MSGLSYFVDWHNGLLDTRVTVVYTMSRERPCGQVSTSLSRSCSAAFRNSIAIRRPLDIGFRQRAFPYGWPTLTWTFVPPPQTRCDIVDVVVHVFVNTGLKTEWSDDARVIVLFTCLNELLAEVKCTFQKRFANRGCIVAYDGHLWDLLVRW